MRFLELFGGFRGGNRRENEGNMDMGNVNRYIR